MTVEIIPEDRTARQLPHRRHDRRKTGEPLTAWSGFAILGISGGSLAVGILLERRRKQ